MTIRIGTLAWNGSERAKLGETSTCNVKALWLDVNGCRIPAENLMDVEVKFHHGVAEITAHLAGAVEVVHIHADDEEIVDLQQHSVVDPEHDGLTGRMNDHGQMQTSCTCGWVSGWRDTADEASTARSNHLREVGALPAVSKQGGPS